MFPIQQVEIQHDAGSTVLEVEEDQTILEAALDSGLELSHDCKMGVCMTCPAKLVRQGAALVCRDKQTPLQAPLHLPQLSRRGMARARADAIRGRDLPPGTCCMAAGSDPRLSSRSAHRQCRGVYACAGGGAGGPERGDAGRRREGEGLRAAVRVHAAVELQDPHH
jgi:2Fe-2S iron-sulfur cluster binding domain